MDDQQLVEEILLQEEKPCPVRTDGQSHEVTLTWAFPPMDTFTEVPQQRAAVFNRESVFGAVSRGDASGLRGLLDFLNCTNKRLTDLEFTESNGKTVLLKALLNLKDNKNDTINVLLDIAEKTGDLKKLIDASYTDKNYHGQTALHVAIERRSLVHVELLVQRGANVQAKANGKFFQLNKKCGFYFGELPLSLAACTNQPEVVSFLLDNPYKPAKGTDRDSEGNSVLHALVVIADNSPENTDMIANMYDKILTEHHALHRDRLIRLEDIQNNQGLTPLKLAAKLGKIRLLKHMLNREFVDKESRPLSRKFTEWVYGPVHSSLYDTSSIDTDEQHSVLEIIVFGSQIPNRMEMLQLEPLRSLIEDKWECFASKLFLLNFVVYMVYLSIFTAVSVNRKVGQAMRVAFRILDDPSHVLYPMFEWLPSGRKLPCVGCRTQRRKPPFPIKEFPVDYLLCTGQIISLLGALWFIYRSIMIFKRNPLNCKCLHINGFSDILFFIQGALLLLCIPPYICGHRTYLDFQAISLALAWINTLYYARGIKQLGIYSVMMERMLLRDILHFLCVYLLFLFGFSAALVTIIIEFVEPESVDESSPHSYRGLRKSFLELFKFTIGMGNLEFGQTIDPAFGFLLILYIVLTYILMLNMLIAIMGNTVAEISSESENIWNLQRSQSIMDLDRILPMWLKKKLSSTQSKIIIIEEQNQRLFRVEEPNWTKWRSDLYVFQQEHPRKADGELFWNVFGAEITKHNKGMVFQTFTTKLKKVHYDSMALQQRTRLQSQVAGSV